MSREEIVNSVLKCPVCKSGMSLSPDGRSLCCDGVRRHSYDISSEGYVNLASPMQSNGGDSKQAVRARTSFLDTGYYKAVSDKLCEILKKYCKSGGTVVDAGCGEGYYSVAAAECGFNILGFDLSKFAVGAAAKRAKRSGNENAFFSVASVFTLPVENKTADAVINIFAPCAEDEYSRILKDDGVLIVVHAGEEHLLGLKSAIYREAHRNEQRADMPCHMKELEAVRLKYNISVEGNQSIKALFAMTPYYWKTSQKDSEKLDGIEHMTTEVDMIFSVYGFDNK